MVGATVGAAVGATVGAVVGAVVGATVGAVVGATVGVVVGEVAKSGSISTSHEIPLANCVSITIRLPLCEIPGICSSTK
uniref:glycine zipper domain-containing protein n=1 Tax=Lactiplantibacillus TaxID=2767842 RepID=UPI00384EEBBF